MTNKEIKLSARKNISQNMGNCVSLTAFLFAVFVFLGLCELALFMLFKRIGWEYFFSWQGIKDHVSVRLFWFLDLIVIIPFASFEMWTVRRFFVDIARADSYVGSRQYINSHSYVYYSHTMFSSIIINSLKLFSAVPFAISTYSVYYWGWVCKLSELTSAGLLCLMLSLGLSVVFFGLMVHYWISLALAPYIMTLNPRTNIFDACDLSVRLMDGQHGRYISFLLSFVMYIPALLLVYPVFIIYPYFRLSYIVFLQDIMGSYWQDKMPSMIKRWRKYSK